MNNLEKVNYIREKCEEHDITAYEIGKNTKISTYGVQRILNGESKNPHKKSLELIRLITIDYQIVTIIYFKYRKLLVKLSFK